MRSPLGSPLKLKSPLRLGSKQLIALPTLSGLVYQTTADSLVAADGTALTSLPGNLTTTGSGATFRTNVLNGLPVYRFAATGNFATTANTGISGNASYCMIATIRFNALQALEGVFGFGNVNIALNAAGLLIQNAYSAAYAGGNSAFFGTFTPGNFVILTIIKIPGAINTTSRLRINQQERAITSGSTNTPNIANSPLYIGQWANLATDRFNGDLYSLALASPCPSDTEIIAYERALSNNTGIV